MTQNESHKPDPYSSLTWQIASQRLGFVDGPLVMGIVNVTPDSFSDGGQWTTTEAAVAHGLDLVMQGADLLDIGGESTRPGAEPVPLDQELRRVVPVIIDLAKRTKVPLSIDTSKAEVARQCLAAGARIVNDVTALRADPSMAQVVREAGAGLILMHMQGTPTTMQVNPHYEEILSDIGRFFEERLQYARTQGIAADQIMLDPGIGFGKAVPHNLEILARLDQFGQSGRPVCLGVSRKGFISKIAGGGRPVERRLAGALAVLAFSISRRAVHVIRVHDVEAHKDIVVMWRTIRDYSSHREG